MRAGALLTAVFVGLAAYLLIFERAAVLEFAGRAPAAETVTAAPGPQAPDAAARPAVAVVAMRARAVEAETAVRLRGRTEAWREVETRAETAARVISEPLRRGATVAAGDLLCRLDPANRPAALAEARALRTQAAIANRAAQTLVDRGFTAETRAAETAAAMEAAEAAVRRAEIEIERLEIRAPFPGVLETDSAEIGSLLDVGGLCATVMQLDPIRLVGFVRETEVARVAPGARAEGRLADGQTIAGEVVFVGRSADPETRTFRVDIAVPNPEGRLRDGQTAEIAVAADGAKAHLVPASALTLDDSGRLGLRLAEAGHARFVPVQMLRDTPEGIWVLGLPDEAAVIVRGQEYVADGVPVAVTWQESDS